MSVEILCMTLQRCNAQSISQSTASEMRIYLEIEQSPQIMNQNPMTHPVSFTRFTTYIFFLIIISFFFYQKINLKKKEEEEEERHYFFVFVSGVTEPFFFFFFFFIHRNRRQYIGR